MSASGRPFTDEVLNRVLDLWLDGGPATMPEGSLESALRAVAVTPQRRWRGRLLRFSGASPLVPVGLSLAAITAVVALGIGIGSVLPPTGTDASPTPEVSTTPAPSAEPSDAANERLVWYTNSEDGYELRLPESWAASAMRVHSTAGDSVPGVTRIARHLWSMTISIGTADGTVSICDRLGLCQPVVVKTLDELDAAVVSSPVDLNGTVAVDEVNLGGEVGRLEFPRTTCTADLCTVHGRGGSYMFTPSVFPGTRTVVAIHNGRPVILQFEWFSSSPAEVQAMIDSFRFLDADATPAPTALPTGGDVVSFPDRGIELTLPTGWTAWTNAPDTAVFLERLGSGRASISVGDPTGEIRTCPESSGPWEVCRDVKALTLAELTAAVEPIYADEHGITVPGLVTRGTLVLDGEDANRVNIKSYEYPARGYEHVTYILAIHDGQPFIIRFHTMLNEPPDGWISDFLSGFRFLD